jgi:hypothetical protein
MDRNRRSRSPEYALQQDLAGGVVGQVLAAHPVMFRAAGIS